MVKIWGGTHDLHSPAIEGAAGAAAGGGMPSVFSICTLPALGHGACPGRSRISAIHDGKHGLRAVRKPLFSASRVREGRNPAEISLSLSLVSFIS